MKALLSGLHAAIGLAILAGLGMILVPGSRYELQMALFYIWQAAMLGSIAGFGIYALRRV